MIIPSFIAIRKKDLVVVLRKRFGRGTKSLKNQPRDVIKMRDYPSLFMAFLSHFSSYDVTWLFLDWLCPPTKISFKKAERQRHFCTTLVLINKICAIKKRLKGCAPTFVYFHIKLVFHNRKIMGFLQFTCEYITYEYAFLMDIVCVDILTVENLSSI